MQRPLSTEYRAFTVETQLNLDFQILLGKACKGTAVCRRHARAVRIGIAHCEMQDVIYILLIGSKMRPQLRFIVLSN